MVNIIEMVQPTPSPLWAVIAQAGITDVVTMMDGAEQAARFVLHQGGEPPVVPAPPPRGERPWDQAPLAALQQHYADHGFRLVAVEDTAPMDLVRLGLPGRDEQISHIIDQVVAMGELEIPVLCYNWMAVSSWARTDTAVPLRGGAIASGFDRLLNEARPPLVEPGSVTHEQLWSALQYFLEAVIPVAESAGVTLGLHPDDPPLPVIRGLPRIASSVESYRRVLQLVDSPANSITLCQGNFCLMTDDLPSVIREFAGRIAFVHFRDVRGEVDAFHETFHDEGKTDMAACMRAYHEIGFTGPMRPDHVPTLVGEENTTPGYASNGRLFAVGYIRGLREAYYGRPSSQT